jgi:hypothetical protein
MIDFIYSIAQLCLYVLLFLHLIMHDKEISSLKKEIGWR